MQPSRIRWRLLILLVTGLAAPFGFFFLRPGPARPKVLLIGVDGAEWDMIDPLIAQGKLPNFARLQREGAYGTLRSIEPILSPIIWTSIATGKTPEKHGIGWFMVESEKTGKKIPVTSQVRRCKALWNILSDRGLRAGVVGWWATYPAETIDGFIVTDFLAYHNFGVTGQSVKSDLGKTYPLELIEEVQNLEVDPAELPVKEVSRFVAAPPDEIEACQSKGYDFSDPLSHFLHILATAEMDTAIGTTLYPRERPDLFAVYYEGIDSVSHLFMKYAEPPLPDTSPEAQARYRHLVERFYAYQDAILGRYLDLADDETIVIVVSDHGFKTGPERPHEDDAIRVGTAHEWHDIDGIVLMRGPGIKAGVEIPESSVLDITPTILYALGLPVARDMDGKVILDAFQPSYLAGHPIRRVTSFEGPSVPAASIDVDEGIARAMEERLTQLGYLGASPDDSSPQIHLNLAESALEAGDKPKAERELLVAARLAPDTPAPHAMLARLYQEERRFADARKQLELAMSLAPGALDLRMRFGALCSMTGDLETARTVFLDLEKKAPRWADVPASLGDVYSRLGQLDQAEAALRRALELDPESLLARFNLGTVLGRLDRNEEAAAAFRAVLNKDPANAYALNNLGNILSRLDRHEEALELYAKSLEKDPDNFEALYNCGTTCLTLGKAEEALSYLKKAVTRRPEGRLAHKNLARAYLQTGRPAKAYQEYQAITRLFPRDFEAWIQAARLPKRPEREAEVESWLAGAWSLDPDKTAQIIDEDPGFDGIDPEHVAARARGNGSQDRDSQQNGKQTEPVTPPETGEKAPEKTRPPSGKSALRRE